MPFVVLSVTLSARLSNTGSNEITNMNNMSQCLGLTTAGPRVFPFRTTGNLMPKKDQANTKPSQPEKVEAYMAGLYHPMKDVLRALLETILAADPNIGEEIKWNAP